MASDLALDKIVYLPDGAPPGEIRLLEINRLLNVPDPEIIEPLDFGPDIDGISFNVSVADITFEQWRRLEAGRGAALPEGWSLKDSITYDRG